MLLIRPEAAQRVTVFGSTRKSAATSPGVSKRSLLSSTIIRLSCPYRLSLSVPTNMSFHPDFRKIDTPVISRHWALRPRCIAPVSYCGQVPEPVSVAEITAAAQRIAGVVVRTPLVAFPGHRMLIKPESLQPNGSFKLRGAYAAISALGEQARRRGVIAHSSGNHAGAVSYAAALLGVRAVVVIPANTPQVKRSAVLAAGAEIVTVEPSLTARMAATSELVDRHGYALIPPFDDRRIIAGQGTIGLEIAADCPAADLVVVPVGGWSGSSPNWRPTPATRCARDTASPGIHNRPGARSPTRSASSRSARSPSSTSAVTWTTS